MSVLEIKHDLMKLLVETDDAELLHQVETINELIEAAEQDEGTSYETFKAKYQL